VLEFLAQGRAVDTEYFSGLALVAIGVLEHCPQQGQFNLAKHQAIQIAGLVAVEVAEIVVQGFFGEVPQGSVSQAGKRGFIAGLSGG